jgi:regulatory protein
MARAMELLAGRAWGTAELAARLGREFSESTAAAVVERLSELALLDDEAFAEAWARRRSERGGLGVARIREELLARGIDEGTAGRAVEALGGDENRARALASLERFLKTRSRDDARTPAAAARHLLRRGFDEDLVRDLLDRQWRDLRVDS